MLVALAALHAGFALTQPPPQLAGDELHYLRTAQEDLRRGDTRLVPGALRFGHRPELQSRVLAQLADEDTEAVVVLRRASGLQLAALLVLVAFVFAQARALELSPHAALLAATLVAVFPWLGFHVHALWPELLHAACFALALWALLHHWRGGGWVPLVAGGLATGVALLAKGTLAPFVPLAVAGLAAGAWQRGGEARLRAVASATLPFVLGLALVVVPQLVANANAGHGARLAANRWWNLELGVVVPVDASTPGAVAADGSWRGEQVQTQRYAAAARRAPEREARARERVLAYVAENGALRVGAAQVAKLGDLLWAQPSLLPARRANLDQALDPGGRWGHEPPGLLHLLQEPARWLWRGFWLFGLTGVLLLARASPGGVWVAGFGFAFLAAALAVPVKVRFLLPAVPVLALGCAAWLDRVAHWRARHAA